MLLILSDTDIKGGGREREREERHGGRNRKDNRNGRYERRGKGGMKVVKEQERLMKRERGQRKRRRK